MTEVLIPSLENLPGLFITKSHVYDAIGKTYYRYDLVRYDKPLLSFTSSEDLPNDHVKFKLIYKYNQIAYELLDFYKSPAFQTMKEYNYTLKAIDKL